MKRKLCVAIALIGDPEVVLLDEPSAGLDPVSRRNLWSVILRTMSHRAVILTTHSMDEAEALCKRIGIMVNGQLRALGTKQHLKNKFGSGFELVVKLVVKDFEKQVAALDCFVIGMFPSALVISENGGLITYTIPREEMKMGLAFTQLEAHKKQLSIEDYSVAQPTLEQVFIRTVNKHTPGTRKNAGSATVIGGSAMMSVEGTDLLDAELEDNEDEFQIFGEVVKELNKCGCTTRTATIILLVLLALTVVLLIIAIAVGASGGSGGGVVGLFAFLFFVALLISCCVRYCAVCQQPKGADE
jgi:energy-coupling factor transporter ATP-binding protein EcfA2